MWTVVRFIERSSYGVGIVGAWLIVPLIGGMVYEVIARYVFNAPTFWAFEFGYMLMGASFLFGIAYALRERRHIRVDFLYDNLNPKQQALIDLFGYLLLLPVVWWTTWGLWGYAVNAYQLGEVSGVSAWNPVIWPFRATFVIGFAGLGLQATVETIKCVYVLLGKEIPGSVHE